MRKRKTSKVIIVWKNSVYLYKFNYKSWKLVPKILQDVSNNKKSIYLFKAKVNQVADDFIKNQNNSSKMVWFSALIRIC